MSNSAAKIVASCFAVLACLLCIPAAPVAGQSTKQSPPAASPPVLSPTPNAAPTPIPIQITVTTPPAQSAPPSPTFLGMPPADWKAIWITFVSNLISGAVVIFVALRVTRTNEQERLKSQEATEYQKQRMELYKMFYAEQVVAAKKLCEIVTETHSAVNDFHFLGNPLDLARIYKSSQEATLLYNRNEWLFNEDVHTKMRAFLVHAEGEFWACTNVNIDGQKAHGEIDLNLCTIQLTDLTNAVRDMMLSDELSRRIKEQTAPLISSVSRSPGQ